MYDPITEFNIDVFKESVSHNELTIITVIDWYDGPLNGFCIYESNEYYFEISDDLEHYTLYNITLFDKIKILSFFNEINRNRNAR